MSIAKHREQIILLTIALLKANGIAVFCEYCNKFRICTFQVFCFVGERLLCTRVLRRLAKLHVGDSSQARAPAPSECGTLQDETPPWGYKQEGCDEAKSSAEPNALEKCLPFAAMQRVALFRAFK